MSGIGEGFSNPALLGSAFNASNLAYAPEKTKGGEVGYKAELLGRSLRVELSAYSYKFTNLQLSTFNSATFSYFIQNAASARTRGAELSLQWQATERLNLRGNLAYNRGKLLDFPGAPCFQGQTFGQGCTVGLPANSASETTGGAAQNEAGKPLPRAPKFVYTGGFTYEQPVGGDLLIAIDGDTRFSSSYFIDTSLAPQIKQKSYWLWDAGIRLHPEDGRWELALLGRNLSNKAYSNNGVDTAFEPVGVWAVQVERGRQISVQGTLRF